MRSVHVHVGACAYRNRRLSSPSERSIVRTNSIRLLLTSLQRSECMHTQERGRDLQRAGLGWYGEWDLMEILSSTIHSDSLSIIKVREATTRIRTVEALPIACQD